MLAPFFNQKAGLAADTAVKGTNSLRQQVEMRSGSNKGQSLCLLLSCLPAECGQDSSSAPCPQEGRGGWQTKGQEGERETREEGRTGRVRSEVATDRLGIIQIPSIQLESCSLSRAAGCVWGRQAFKPERAPTRRQATVADVVTAPRGKGKRGRETTTLQLGYQ